MADITLTFPDGAKRLVKSGITGLDLAGQISKSLAKKAVAISLDGKLADLADPITQSASVRIVTRTDKEALELIRHDCAHVLAEAVQSLFPGTQVTIGPVIETGFYYDFARNEPFHPDDLPRIEEKMREIIKANRPFTKEVWSREKAKAYFKKQGESYKVELVDAIPAGEDVKIYSQGSWLDLCRGPHMTSTGQVGSGFKLLRISGAYWRGDPKNPQLQRIYGTAFATDQELAAYLKQIEEAEKRDHRRLGREMDLFHFQEETAGSVFWHPNGWLLYRTLEDFVRRRISAAGYVEVNTPQLVDSSLFKASGHWDIYGDNMFKIVVPPRDGEGEARHIGLKPMNCPCHVQIFNQGIKSYRDLPLRMAEFGTCMRNEPHGALHGLMRVRHMVQDDAHIFCTDDQIQSESIAFCDLLRSIYADLGFDVARVRLADRPAQRVGSDAVWDKAENALHGALKAAGLAYDINPGDGAFYGPKLEFYLRDAIGREWQCGTLQVDFNLPERLDANYIGEDGAKHRPVMLHRAILGSLQRFIGVLIEHTGGHLPLWLAPVQAVIATIVSDADAYAREVKAALTKAGVRAEVDLRNEKINYKVREHSLAKVPVLLVVGKREAEERKVSVRRLGSQEQTVLALDEIIAGLAREVVPPDLRS
jgi:threonyl-tRNA synthetase